MSWHELSWHELMCGKDSVQSPLLPTCALASSAAEVSARLHPCPSLSCPSPRSNEY